MISKLEIRPLFLHEIFENGKECIMLGGDKVIPILKIDDKKVGNGEVGEICKYF